MKESTRREAKQLAVILAVTLAIGGAVFLIFFRHS